MDPERIAREIKVLVEKGDYAKEKAQQFYIAAGLHLKTLRDATSSKGAWARLIKEKCDLGISRAYELMQIADGRTTVAKVRAAANERKAKHRAARPFRNGQPESPAPAPLDPDTAAEIERLAHQLVQLDIALARELRRVLRLGGTANLVSELGAGLDEIEGRANGGAISIPDRSPTSCTTIKSEGEPLSFRHPAERSRIHPARDVKGGPPTLRTPRA
jgi:hypothetical protein